MRGLFAYLHQLFPEWNTPGKGEHREKGALLVWAATEGGLRPCPLATKERYGRQQGRGPSPHIFYCCTDVAGARSSTELTGRLPG